MTLDLTTIANNIKKSGFVLEHDVTNLLKAHHWSVINNRYYVDDVQETAREIDLVAYKANKIEKILIYTTLIISCKKSEANAWSLLFRDHAQDDPNINWYPTKFWANDERLKHMIGKPEWLTSYLEMAKGKGLFEKIFEPSGQLFAFQEINKTNSTVQNDKNIFNAVSSLMKAEAYEMNSLERGRKKITALYNFNLLSIVDSELIKLHFSSNSISPTQIDEAKCVFSYIINKQETSSRIHFCTYSSLDSLLKNYNALHDSNLAFFKTLLDKFYENIFSDKKRREVLRKEFEGRMLWRYNYFFGRDTGRRLDLQQLSFHMPIGGGKLEIELDGDSDVIAFFNNCESAKESTKRALAAIYKYSGEYIFTEYLDLPF